MIPKQCKRLAEVDFPIAAVSAHSAREKSIRHGHPSTLHLWWARRPLAACRSMLMALLLPDPCDLHCPEQFKREARRILNEFPQYTADRFQKMMQTDTGLRQLLLHEFIADFANWDNAANPAYLKTARALVKAAHGEEAPLVVDPFAGGGSIPLEALRIGCDAFASDLNPLACLINKVLLEDIPRHSSKLAEELRRVGGEIKRQAEVELAEFYPSDADGARPIAYIWGRAVRCEQPDCGAEIPIFKSGWLSKKGSKRAKYFKEAADGKCVALFCDGPKGGPVTLRILRGDGSENPRPGFIAVPATKATGNNSNVLCPCCDRLVAGDRVMAQLGVQHGGASTEFDSKGRRLGGAFLLAVVTYRDGMSGKRFRTATADDLRAVCQAGTRFSQGDNHAPEGKLNPTRPSPNARGVTAPTRYGIQRFSDLFTPRQRLTLTNLAQRIVDAHKCGHSKPHVSSGLALAFGRTVDQSSAQVRWISNIEAIASSFPRQALQMTWDYVESVPVGEQSANFGAALEWVCKVVENQGAAHQNLGHTQQADARRVPLPDDSTRVFFTDPPYYDAVPYADLADFFLSWLKPAFSTTVLSGLRFDADDGLSPKADECTWNRAHLVNGVPKSPAYFESSMREAFRDGRRLLADDGVGCVVFAHKTTEGWEALLGGLLAGNWVICASWPIVTERGVRTNAQNTASLASSVHLICRPRDDKAGIGDWGGIIRELPKRIGDWMERLSGEGIRGADLVFACIGPALERFSKYAHVETPDGEEVGLAANDKAHGEPARRGFLSYVWEYAGRTALNQVLGTAEARARNGAAGALEEDARLTALFLWTLQATEAAANGKDQSRARKQAVDDEDEADDAAEGDDDAEESGTKKGKKKAGLSLIYDVARRFAQPLGIHLDVWEGRIIETAKGVVRLLPVVERAKQLFGEDGASAVVRRFDSAKKPDPQGMLDFMAEQRAAAVPEVKGRGRKKKVGAEASPESLRAKREATTLDRVHAAMLLQASGATNALRALLEAELDRGPDFLRLANALSALYPRDSEEKRLLDAMLLAVPR